MRVKLILTAIVSLSTGAALGACPTSMADSAAGVYVQFDGYVVRYDRRPDGMVEEVEFDTVDSSGFRYVSHHGLMIAESGEMRFGQLVAGTQETITYDIPPPSVILPGLSYQSNTQVRVGTDTPFDEYLTLVVGPEGQGQFGNCTLATLDITMRTGPAGDQHISTFTYFPALGFAAFTGGTSPGEAPDIYPILGLSTEPPVVADAGGSATNPQAPAK